MYCKDKYDFFYLPIDQKTNCNLGYGYINMVDLESVIRLYKEVGRRDELWCSSMERSGQILEVLKCVQSVMVDYRVEMFILKGDFICRRIL